MLNIYNNIWIVITAFILKNSNCTDVMNENVRDKLHLLVTLPDFLSTRWPLSLDRYTGSHQST